MITILTDQRYLAQRMPAAVVMALRERDIDTVVVTPDAATEIGGPGPLPSPPGVVLARTRDPFTLTLLDRATADGHTPVNTAAAIRTVRDKPQVAQLLADADVPTPRTFLADRPAVLSTVESEAWPLLLKPPYGDNASGIVRVDTRAELAAVDWPHELVLAQQVVAATGGEITLYGVADRVWAVRRPSPLLDTTAHTTPVAVPADARLLAIARTCRELFGLVLYGIDVLLTDAGPVVVDVNDFPNYRGIADAGDAIVDLLGAAAPAGALR